jgi:hypothetical protein
MHTSRILDQLISETRGRLFIINRGFLNLAANGLRCSSKLLRFNPESTPKTLTCIFGRVFTPSKSLSRCLDQLRVFHSKLFTLR